MSADTRQSPAERAVITPDRLAEALGSPPPTPEQAAVIAAPLEPLLVVAGAGSGKTATMSQRITWLVANGLVSPDQILGVTFTRKAAGELATRVGSALRRLRAAGLLPAAAEADGAAVLDPQISTYHSYAASIVQDHGLRLGVERDAVVIGQAQAWQLASQVVEAYDGEHRHFVSAKSRLIAGVLQMSSECAEHLREPADVEAWLTENVARLAPLPYVAGKNTRTADTATKALDRLRTLATIAGLVAKYDEAKRRRGVLDYGDLVHIAARIAQKVPAVRAAERARYPVVVLDEFQDTSHAQASLFRTLFGDGHPVTAVGDPKQSIYGFRGASAGQLHAFGHDFPRLGPDGSVERAPTRYLTTAWRNDEHILDAANLVSAPLSGGDGGSGEASAANAVPPLRARPGAGPGRVLIEQHATTDDEAAAIVDHVIALRPDLTPAARAAAGPAGPGTTGSPEEPPSTAVLCRTRAQIEPIRRALTDRGIPVEVVGLGGLLDTPEIVDVVSTLQVLADPGRSDALMRLMVGARWRIGPRDLMALRDWSRVLASRRERALRQREELDASTPGTAGESGPVESDTVDAASLVEAVDWLPDPGWESAHGRSLSPAGRDRLARLAAELRDLRSYLGDELTTLITQVERAMLLDIEVTARPGVSIHQARGNLDAFADAAASFLAGSPRIDVVAFLGWLEAAKDEENGLETAQPDVRSDAVQLLTAHAAKGLEWDAVIVPGMSVGVFPSDKRTRWSMDRLALPWPLRGDHAHLPQWDLDQPDLKSLVDAEKDYAARAGEHAELEERRLAYVAITRARRDLILTSARWRGGNKNPSALSPFLAELEALTEGEDPAVVRGTWVDDAGTANPHADRPETARWPYDPLDSPVDAEGRRLRPGTSRRPALQRAADEVLEVLAGASGTVPPRREEAPPGSARWEQETTVLLERFLTPPNTAQAQPPTHISASTLVDLDDDAAGVLARLRRPVPRRPSPAARKGTAFHAWVEEWYGEPGMLDLGDVPGQADAHVDAGHDLPGMIAAFQASRFASMIPAAVEAPVETRVGSVVVRGRIDAVFRDVTGHWDLIDWKTGQVPTGRDLANKAVQLALYRLAWSRLHDVPLADVDAAFFYVSHGREVRLPVLADEAALERIVAAAFPAAG
ncbi:ATP-dependent DNA helicase [Tersicoccus solisilvae]|uniref:DNA 3'-5' helicase n=1 Tax=Tersicoccus solisilvae TaxID=1882339 RepID=A0ABQ1P2P1_9MICC|nr:ATP-dependent DNA helicase [Tersicoccus solisilvae]GGC87898.1 ATP-dependent DNA helicase [Tersicoccus solisilvae]